MASRGAAGALLLCLLVALPIALLPLPRARVIVLCASECPAPGGAVELAHVHGFIGELNYLSLQGIRASVYLDRPIPVRWEPLQTGRLLQALNLTATGPTGRGVKVAILDTGVDYRLSAFGGGIGPRGPIIDGYDFVSNSPNPLDTEGHGTAVAYIIRQEAPGASLLVYKVGSGGEILLSALFQALDRALAQGAQVINLSLGTDQPDPSLQALMRRALDKGALVVAAAGNSGPERDTVSYPAAYEGVLAVGSSKPGDAQSVDVQLISSPPLPFAVNLLPMERAPLRNVSGPLIYAAQATPSDVQSLNLEGAIVLAERGGQLPYAYFSSKERLVASKGALALIVFNNQEGIFLGNVSDPMNPGYRPTIPVYSLDRETGLELLRALNEGPLFISIRVFRYATDVSIFSSRGGGLFTIKPNVVAVGEGVATIDASGRPWTPSGTSFSAPQVAALAARLFEVHPNLTGGQIGELISLGTDLLTTRWGEVVSPLEQGSGRPNATKLLKGGLLANITGLVLHLSPAQTTVVRDIAISAAGDSLTGARLIWLDGGLNSSLSMSEAGISFRVSAPPSSTPQLNEGYIVLQGVHFTYNIPILAYVDTLALRVQVQGASVSIGAEDKDIKVANVTVILPTYERQAYRGVSLPFSFTAEQQGLYRLLVQAIAANGTRYTAYAEADVQAASPTRQVDVLFLTTVALLAAFLGLFTLGLALVYRERRSPMPAIPGGAPPPSLSYQARQVLFP